MKADPLDMTTLAPITATKARAILAGFGGAGDIGAHRAPILLAMLTSQIKAEREEAKRIVRDLADAGRILDQTTIAATLAASFANRFEP